ncbi:hypothetical protein EIK77_003281 [Talaromyces pinophilus]|nr:hypothetical protein EIK77_003281 [Talaromyces pinophilus]
MPRRPALMGFLMGISQLGMVAGPLVGGALTSYVSWRWCFYINLPVGGLVAVLLVFLNIPEQIPKPKGLKSVATVLGNLDLIGFALFAPAAIMFLLALQYGGSTYPWNSATIIGLFVGAGVTFIIFMLWEYRVGDKAMIPYSILTIRTVWASCVTYGFLASLLICGSYYLPIYFQAIKNASPMISGVDILPNVIFNNSLRTIIPQQAPDINVKAVIQAGATAFRSVVPASDLQAVLRAYAISIDHVFYLAIGASCAAFLTCWGMGWKDIRKKQGPPGAPGGTKPPAPGISDRPKTDV